MSDFIRYDYATIRAALDDINSRYVVLQQQADQIRSEQNKFANAWEDEQSASAYQAVQTKWNQSFEEINNLLRNVKDAAERAVLSMQQTNSRAAADWQGGR